MAMNKREKAAFQRLEILAALRWTPKVDPDLPIPTEGHTQGWRASVLTSSSGDAVTTVIDGSVRRSWSEPNRNGHGEHTEESRLYAGGWRGVALYSTELLAWKALRHGLELEYAANLSRIDKRISELEGSKGK